MSQGARQDRYGLVAIALHWAIATLVLIQLMLAWRMIGPHTPQVFAVFQLHKSVGVTILALTLARLAWRLTHRPPPLAAVLTGWQRTLAAVSHAGFYVLLVALPLTGWLAVSASPLRLPTLLYGHLPWPDLPGLAGVSNEARHAVQALATGVHRSLAVLLVALLGLHVAGALKHQLSGDAPVLSRMAPGARAGRWAEPRLLLIGLGVAAAVALGLLVSPPRIAMLPPQPAASVAAAAGPLPVQTAEAPSSWRVLPGARLDFTAAWGGQPIPGRFDRWSAEIVFSPHALARSHIRVEVELASVSTGDAQRDAVLPKADWLGAETQPRAVFTAGRIEALGGDRFLAHGALSLHGVTRPLDIPFTLALDGQRAHATGAAALDRTAFMIGQGEFARTDQIPAAVAIRIDLDARQEKSPGSVGATTHGSS